MTGSIAQYRRLAKYYDLIYEWTDYDKEARILLQLIDRYKASGGNSLLDVGCGTGQHLRRLVRGFDCEGMDISDEMLQVAKTNVKGVNFIQGDMVDFNLGRKFDVIICLFSSIGYVRTYRNLARTLNNFAKHLRDGGVVIIEPWFTKSTFRAGHIRVLATRESDDLRVVRVDYSEIKGDLSVIDERVVVVKKGKGIATFKDRMVMGLFENDEFLRLMRKAGLHARYLEKTLARGRGLKVGVKTQAK